MNKFNQIQRSQNVQEIVNRIPLKHIRIGYGITIIVLSIYIIISIMFPFSQNIKVDIELISNKIKGKTEIKIYFPDKYFSEVTKLNFIKIKYKNKKDDNYDIITGRIVSVVGLGENIRSHKYIVANTEITDTLFNKLINNKLEGTYIILPKTGFINYLLNK